MEYVVGLGSNLGTRQAHLSSGVERISQSEGCRVLRVSPIYESDPLGPPQPNYLNAAVRIESSLAPLALLDTLLAIERQLGRVRRERWGPRTLDLDILWAEQPFSHQRLTIPHPELERRAFALAPLLDVAPELVTRYSALLRALGDAPRRAPDTLPEPR